MIIPIESPRELVAKFIGHGISFAAPVTRPRVDPEVSKERRRVRQRGYVQAYRDKLIAQGLRSDGQPRRRSPKGRRMRRIQPEV
jgi:hypothetical protein